MNNETDTIGLLVGSRRKNSFNRQLASLARTMLEEKGQKVEMIEWLDVPFFSQDDEFPTPEAVQKVRDEVMGCSVIWIFTPQYNGQIPGAEKNLLDWLSRGLEPGAGREQTAAYGRKVMITSAGGRAAGAGVIRNMTLLCKAMGMDVIGSAGLALSPESWSSDDVMKTPGVKEMLEGQIDTLLG
ncbi:NADPH-dependent FMN reductase [Faecalibaculum rodentium]|uniref:NADPH-dependent FMN reductase n=1 Tax=Faecalibaculum rodentium TaxID=1702221 RepID=UPI0023F233A7|nr:NADPH-dependent FMN reductase [Faecalibaculum rodentium]